MCILPYHNSYHKKKAHSSIEHTSATDTRWTGSVAAPDASQSTLRIHRRTYIIVYNYNKTCPFGTILTQVFLHSLANPFSSILALFHTQLVLFCLLTSLRACQAVCKARVVLLVKNTTSATGWALSFVCLEGILFFSSHITVTFSQCCIQSSLIHTIL